MAVYYKWIKGCAEGSTLDTGLWSYIKWGSGNASTNTNNLPMLFTKWGRDGEEKSLGYFLTNNASNVHIEQSWTFKNSIFINYLNTNISGLRIGGTDETTGIQFLAKDGITFYTSDGTNNNRHHISIAGGDDPHVTIDKLRATKGAVAEDLSIGGLAATENGLGVKGKIESNNSVHAPYFNATSDMRAKENIKKLPFSALAFINNLNVYQFNYKGKNDTIPGVLAQDVLNSQPEGLSLVDNIDASGENGDYMSIKEDKFIFILMRAVQELKEDNDNLRYELNQLKQKLK